MPEAFCNQPTGCRTGLPPLLDVPCPEGTQHAVGGAQCLLNEYVRALSGHLSEHKVKAGQDGRLDGRTGSEG